MSHKNEPNCYNVCIRHKPMFQNVGMHLFSFTERKRVSTRLQNKMERMVIGNCGFLFHIHHYFVELHGLVVLVFGVGASCMGSDESVPHIGIGVRKVAKHASGVGEIGLQKGVALKNFGVEKESFWEVGVNCAKHLSMNFLEMKHRDSGGFVQQVDKVCVDEVLLALVVGAGGCG